MARRPSSENGTQWGGEWPGSQVPFWVRGARPARPTDVRRWIRIGIATGHMSVTSKNVTKKWQRRGAMTNFLEHSVGYVTITWPTKIMAAATYFNVTLRSHKLEMWLAILWLQPYSWLITVTKSQITAVIKKGIFLPAWIQRVFNT